MVRKAQMQWCNNRTNDAVPYCKNKPRLTDQAPGVFKYPNDGVLNAYEVSSSMVIFKERTIQSRYVVPFLPVYADVKLKVVGCFEPVASIWFFTMRHRELASSCDFMEDCHCVRRSSLNVWCELTHIRWHTFVFGRYNGLCFFHCYRSNISNSFLNTISMPEFL